MSCSIHHLRHLEDGSEELSEKDRCRLLVCNRVLDVIGLSRTHTNLLETGNALAVRQTVGNRGGTVARDPLYCRQRSLLQRFHTVHEETR